ncbi:MAG TPA: hypothetical protein PLX35_16770 [Cyclobacteriaceae bacterium]|nr:hypothetical protein [Cyclobacteriaceae bacterium]
MTHKLSIAVLTVLVLASCENPIRMETTVHEDGSLDKSIVLLKTDSLRATSNMFGINAASGWKVEATRIAPDSSGVTKKEKPEYRIAFGKSFASADLVNNELNNDYDTLFHIRTSLERKFRWFYTYLRYSETYLPVNRFKAVSADDYFNQEDRQFIERLPAEGKQISRADSLYLQTLHVKINETYAHMAFFREQYPVIVELLKRNPVEARWLDTVKRKSDFIYGCVKDLIGDPQFALHMADTLGIPINRKKAAADAKELLGTLNGRVAFMSFANDGKYMNVVNMPWKVVKTNADSVAGQTLVWRPLVTKFLFTEYTMYAEARKMNMIPMGITGLLLLVTFVLWWRKK